MEASSILLFALSVFAACALLTYAPSDPSWFSNGRGAAHNACGRVGANLSALWIQWFGLGAFLFPASLFFIAMNVWKREGWVRLVGTLGGMSVAVISAAVFLTLQWKFWPYSGSLILTGGAFGAWVADLLLGQFNSLGSTVVSLAVFCLAIALSTPMSVARVGAFILSAVGGWCGRLGRMIGTYLLFVIGLVGMKVTNAVGEALHGFIDRAVARTRKEKGERRARTAAGAEVGDTDDEDELLEESGEAGIEIAGEVMTAKKRSRKTATAAQNTKDTKDTKDAKDAKGAKEASEPADPVIGVQAAKAPAPEPQIGPVIGADPVPQAIAARKVKRGPARASEAEGEEQGDAAEVLAATPGEAPNALPELENDATLARASSRKSAGPEILPHEKQPPAGATLAPADTEDQAAGAAASGIGAFMREAGQSPASTEIAEKVASKLAKAAQRSSRRGTWQLPTIEFLRKVPKVESAVDKEKLLANAAMLKQKFADFQIDGEVTAVRPGPVITLYEFKPGPGIKVSRIASMADDLAMALSAQSVRILAPLPGKSVVGIEIPSEVREKVYFREFLQDSEFSGARLSIPVVMGKDISGTPYLSDLAKMPHLLVAGQTGSGKSVFMNGLICSLLYRFTPDELRLIMIDPKTVEFRAYHDIPHLLLPVVEDPGPASVALKWAVREMDRRYRVMAKTNSRNLASFNQKVEEMGADVVRDLLFAEESSESAAPTTGADWIEAFEPDETGAPRVAKLPYIIIIIDELADLMMIAKKEVEISIARIAQKARAAGIHLVIATQRPSTDVVTGLIKANLPSRCSFQLSSNVDSRTILDRVGAERLLGHGDMLFIPPGVSNSLRLHGAFLDDDEIAKITSFLKGQGKPNYRDEILIDNEEDEDGEGGDGDGDDEADALFNEAVELVKRSGHASASFLQRHLKVGYNRAARMIESMERKGIVGPGDGARPREVLLR